MAQNNSNSGIQNGWSLMAFAKMHGRMKLGTFTNKDTKEEFRCPVFVKPKVDESTGEILKDEDGKEQTIKTFVSFSSKMGELTGAQIKEMKDELRVVQLASGNYSLCKQGDDTWEDVDLGI
jgi:hypothetical protein